MVGFNSGMLVFVLLLGPVADAVAYLFLQGLDELLPWAVFLVEVLGLGS